MSLKYSQMILIEFDICKPYSLKMCDSSVEKKICEAQKFSSYRSGQLIVHQNRPMNELMTQKGLSQLLGFLNGALY